MVVPRVFLAVVAPARSQSKRGACLPVAGRSVACAGRGWKALAGHPSRSEVWRIMESKPCVLLPALKGGAVRQTSCSALRRRCSRARARANATQPQSHG
eukprot:13132492-Alexandrium_andersonii.AAC.1